jgi:putative SOS response-associated peptidase YedK
MCGRMILAADPAELMSHFGLDRLPDLTARYNIAPAQQIAVVAPKQDPTKRGLALLRWGLVPHWSKDGKAGPINARCETVGGLASFSDAFRHRRCIVPATGFYEWQKARGRKVPHRFRLASGGVMGFAGLWEPWTGPDKKVLFTCCVITTAANELVNPYHDRMPAIRAPSDYATWLDHDRPLREIHALLGPYPAELMAESAASTRVNSAKNEGAQLLDPAA